MTYNKVDEGCIIHACLRTIYNILEDAFEDKSRATLQYNIICEGIAFQLPTPERNRLWELQREIDNE